MSVQSKLSETVIEEEDEGGNMANYGSSGNHYGSLSTESQMLTREEAEVKRKAIRDFIFKSECNLGGILNAARDT
jgi:hypothetical protein